eukprot:COSAG05_NODE_1510_length_4685_cov_3.769298_7_plen_272_part_00
MLHAACVRLCWALARHLLADGHSRSSSSGTLGLLGWRARRVYGAACRHSLALALPFCFAGTVGLPRPLRLWAVSPRAIPSQAVLGLSPRRLAQLQSYRPRLRCPTCPHGHVFRQLLRNPLPPGHIVGQPVLEQLPQRRVLMRLPRFAARHRARTRQRRGQKAPPEAEWRAPQAPVNVPGGLSPNGFRSSPPQDVSSGADVAAVAELGRGIYRALRASAQLISLLYGPKVQYLDPVHVLVVPTSRILSLILVVGAVPGNCIFCIQFWTHLIF